MLKKLATQAAIGRLRKRFERLYPNQVDQCLRRLEMMIGRYGIGTAQDAKTGLWSEKDAVLITYGDSIKSPEGSPLEALYRFATRHFMGAISTIHILPCFPYSSDDGFSVINYRKVDPELGTWKEIGALKGHFDLMFDLVLNHVSAKSTWFRDYRNCILPYRDYFHEESPESDLSQVVRPRTSPLLTRVMTKAGPKHVWTTFSADQIDLNWANPDVFFEMLDVLFGYIDKGARIVRLDAVAFLWKRRGTNCLHLEETHEVIRLIREILQMACPSVLLLTETNVPHTENISYFGQADEAHMVYQFTLPPLVLHGLLKGTAKHIAAWARSLPELPDDCAFFNFTASHDGIGVRPLEGILPDEEIDFLGDEVKQRGGRLSFRTRPDGSKSVYEMNVTYYSALTSVGEGQEHYGEARFLCSQLVAAALKGIPGFYIHSLIASQNDYQGVEESGMPRRINRHKWDEETLERRLQDTSTHHHRLFYKLIEILRRRARCDAFHPNASQAILDIDARLFGILRKASKSANQVLCLANFSPQNVDIDVTPWIAADSLHELISDTPWSMPAAPLTLKAYETVWLSSRYR